MDEQHAVGKRGAGAGRPVREVEGPEPGRSYFTALRRWPEVARITRTELAKQIGCSQTYLSELLSNSGPATATTSVLQWAQKIIKACGGTEKDLEKWADYHGTVVKYQADGGTGPVPVPPEPARDHGPSSPAAPSGSSVPGRKLSRLSERLAAELDVSSSQRLDSDQHRLSAGLYVRRTQQDVILDMLRPVGYDKPILVHGVAGEGKSSLLWGLYQELKDSTVLEAYLLNSPWLAATDGGVPTVSVDELYGAAEQARSRGRVAVFLVDTVDLLLHDELHRQQVLDICDVLTEMGAEVALTSRPEEALTLPKASFRTVGLRPYDDIELPQAIDKHVAVFCPDALPGAVEEKTRLIVDSAARGLTVREIVLNPLKLRLLFELYQPDFPSLEHDMSSLYEMYWKRRVRADQRGEVGIVDGTDLSLSAEHIAIALLAAGRTELGERLLLTSATSVAAGWHGDARDYRDVLADTEAAVTGLARRGVLIRSGHVVRFFHQTMFEYAAAVGLLARDRAPALAFLVDHLKAHPDDLFVGAVTEQALILAVDDALITHDAVAILNDMAASGMPSLQRIALGVLAHQPCSLEATERLIDTVDTAALRRYAQTVPTVAKVDVGLQVAMLVRVWRRGEPVRESVLEALERLSARNPAIVVATLRELDCVETALSWKDNPARMVKLVARVLVSAANPDPLWTRERLLALFDGTMDRNTNRNVVLHLIDLIAGGWATLGSPETAAEIQDRIVRSQRRHDAAASEMRKALGRILALAWRDRLVVLEDRADGSGPQRDVWWMEIIEDLCECLERDYYDVLANARLHGVAELITVGELGVSLAVRTIERLCALRGSAPFALGGTLFLRLLAADDGAADNPVAPVTPVVLALLDGLPAPGNRPPEGPRRWAHVVRQALHDAELPAHRIASFLADLPTAQHLPNWLADDHLSVLLVPAAVGRHPVASAALDRVAANAGVLSATGQKNISYEIVRHLDAHPNLLPILIELSVRRVSATPLSDVVLTFDGELLTEMRTHSGRLIELVELLFDGKGSTQKEAASLWRRLYQVGALPAPDHETLVRRFQATSEQAARGNILDLATDVALDGALEQHTVDRMLRGLFEVDPQIRATVLPGGKAAGHVSITARAAWLRLNCHSQQPDEVDLDELLDVATAAPATVDTLAMLGHMVDRLARQGKPTAAAGLLLRVAAAVGTVKLSPKQENALANRLRAPMRMIFRSTTMDSQRELLAQVPNLPRTHARVLASAAAQENFHVLRPTLAALLQGNLPDGVAQQIHDDIRVRARSAAKGALPLLILPLAVNLDVSQVFRGDLDTSG